MQNILVPTDFSPQAHNAFEVALQLAHRTGGRLILLHVVDAPQVSAMVTTGGVAGNSSMEGVYMVQLLQRTKRRMHELRDEVAGKWPEVAVEDRIATGSVDESILDVVREQHIDLVVLGAQEHAPGIHLFTPDSHAERLVRLAPCPVLTVKHPAPDFAVRSIVFASDFSEEAGRAMNSLRQLSTAFPNAKLHLLDVVTSAHAATSALDRIHAFAKRHQLVNYHPDVFTAGEVGEGIPTYAAQTHADLLVMLTHGHTGLSHLWHNNLAEHVAVQAATPVLTVHT
ncbi:universal stress protein [Hymenobacter cavernae]|uniref:Universal stress protein UspA n=1 Tax=Hymenobacter cavernae TaxID=2044852 RepID=A0ABQ1UFI7_9BACT|nr:universal stress protein [Hymenobacter cavernae]GGF15382.1 universal stress protein UspA [Hymenobacter cavernae]